MDDRKKISILGTRGIPAAHGGFETFAERFARFLAIRDWDVTVYCQVHGEGPITEDTWEGIRRVLIPIRGERTVSTILFDWKSTLHAARSRSPKLVLGYNTAIFSLIYRLRGIRSVMNMDGMEWKRDKWGPLARTWFYINEWLGCWLSNVLIADHPEIAVHLSSRVSVDKIRMIPYGTDFPVSEDLSVLEKMQLKPREYALVVARTEPENSILEIVRAFSCKPRGKKLVVLGRMQPDTHKYHCMVADAASDEVCFVGAIYDRAIVNTLRSHAAVYVHGHRFGGTNPSLVESLGTGSAVIAHDNRFNRWVAGDAARYFSDIQACAKLFDTLLNDDASLRSMRSSAQQRAANQFTWTEICSQYEQLILQVQATPSVALARTPAIPAPVEVGLPSPKAIESRPVPLIPARGKSSIR